MRCKYCGHDFPEKCGKYGCPNCNAEGLGDMKKTQTDYNRKFLERQKAAGLVRVTVMLPAESAEHFKQLAEVERNRHLLLAAEAARGF